MMTNEVLICLVLLRYLLPRINLHQWEMWDLASQKSQKLNFKSSHHENPQRLPLQEAKTKLDQ